MVARQDKGVKWIVPGTTSRGRGFAFAAPLRPGKTEADRQVAHEAFMTRRDDHTQSRLALAGKLNREEVYLNPTLAGDIVVYLEGEDPIAATRAFAASQTPYDRWFK